MDYGTGILPTELIKEDAGISTGSYAGAGGANPGSDKTSTANMSYVVGPKPTPIPLTDNPKTYKKLKYNPETGKWGKDESL
jgi:hypothetical protein